MALQPETRLEELRMIRYSLLPEEVLEFVYDRDFWEPLVDGVEIIDVGSIHKSDPEPFASTTFTLKVKGADVIWVQITVPVGTPGSAQISMKSDTLPRSEVDSLQRMVNERLDEASDDE
jgi:hypothetical protein